MNYTEKKESELRTQIIPQTKRSDFDSFWEEEVKKLRSVELKIEREVLELPYKTFNAYKIRFSTHDDTVVVGYFYVPRHMGSEKLPCAIYFHGGGGHGAIVPDIVSTGVCSFSIDVRSQGGETYDRAKYDVVDDYRGSLMTHGVLDKHNFYMRNIYLDAIRTVDVMAAMPEVDAEKIVVYGASQGGALSIVAGALSGKVKKVYTAVPSYGCLEQRLEAGSGVFAATKSFLTLYPEHTDTVLETLSYFDVNNMSSKLDVPSLFQLGLSDPTCLPKFVYSIYAHASGPKEILICPFTPHTISFEYKMRAFGEFAKL